MWQLGLTLIKDPHEVSTSKGLSTLSGQGCLLQHGSRLKSWNPWVLSRGALVTPPSQSNGVFPTGQDTARGLDGTRGNWPWGEGRWQWVNLAQCKAAADLRWSLCCSYRILLGGLDASFLHSPSLRLSWNASLGSSKVASALVTSSNPLRDRPSLWLSTEGSLKASVSPPLGISLLWIY
jgi:hypothetical protein